MLKPDRLKRQTRIRSKISGTTTRPRVSVYRSNKFVYAQAIDDDKSITLAQSKSESGKEVGQEIAKQLIAVKVTEVVFDRGGYRYHGRVQQVAEGLREGGIKV